MERKSFLSDAVRKKLAEEGRLHSELVAGKRPQEILELNDEEMAELYGKANALFHAKKYDEARNAFFFLVTLNPDNYEFWLGLGMATQMEKDFEAAIDAYEVAAIRELDNPVPYFYLAKCLFAIHDRPNAKEALDLAIEYAGDRPEFASLKEQAILARKLLNEHQ